MGSWVQMLRQMQFTASIVPGEKGAKKLSPAGCNRQVWVNLGVEAALGPQLGIHPLPRPHAALQADEGLHTMAESIQTGAGHSLQGLEVIPRAQGIIPNSKPTTSPLAYAGCMLYPEDLLII